MKASEARKAALANSGGKADPKQLKMVEGKITKAVEEGEFEAIIYATLNKGTIKALEDDGYKVDSFGHKQLDNFKISW